MHAERTLALAKTLDDAMLRSETVPQLTLTEPELDVVAAYRVQRAGVGLRAGRGEHLVGMKMGLTSHAKMAQVGVNEPIYAHLTSHMALSDGGALVRAEFGHPRAEPEVAFLLGSDLEGPTDAAGALKAVSGVRAALEVIDSRYRDFKFSLPDVVADNASSCRFVVGPIVPLAELAAKGLSLDALDVQLVVNGEVVHSATSAAILGDPAESLAALANMLATVGEKLSAGMIVLAGAATAAVHLEAGMRVSAVVEGLGEVSLNVR
jgi:2-oxo-3-hexenedioate decarboxylase